MYPFIHRNPLILVNVECLCPLNCGHSVFERLTRLEAAAGCRRPLDPDVLHLRAGYIYDLHQFGWPTKHKQREFNKLLTNDTLHLIKGAQFRRFRFDYLLFRHGD